MVFKLFAKVLEVKVSQHRKFENINMIFDDKKKIPIAGKQMIEGSASPSKTSGNRTPGVDHAPAIMFPKQLFMVKTERKNLYNSFSRKFEKLFKDSYKEFLSFKKTYNRNIAAQTEIQVEITEEINVIKTALEELNI